VAKTLCSPALYRPRFRPERIYFVHGW